MRRGASGINCLLAIDKPEGLTSHDVVGRVRRALGERRVGHAGTLDPAATGVLVMGVGQATRLLGQLTLDDKRYIARIDFGCETTTDDAEGEPTRTADVPERLADEAFAQKVLRELEGTAEQVPPAFSAISVDGRRSYDRARSGEQVALAPRVVTIHEARLIGISSEGTGLSWTCSFWVSKGTYVRSLARDLGRKLDTAAHLSALRRTASGPVGLSTCLTLDELASLDGEGLLSRALDPAQVLGLASHELTSEELGDVLVGRRIACPQVTDGAGIVREPLRDERVTLTHRGKFMGIWQRRGALLCCLANFPDGIAGVR